MQVEQIISDCSAAIQTFDCTELANGNAPLACGGLSPSSPTSGPVSTPSSLDAVRSTGYLMGQHASIGGP